MVTSSTAIGNMNSWLHILSYIVPADELLFRELFNDLRLLMCNIVFVIYLGVTDKQLLYVLKVSTIGLIWSKVLL